MCFSRKLHSFEVFNHIYDLLLFKHNQRLYCPISHTYLRKYIYTRIAQRERIQEQQQTEEEGKEKSLYSTTVLGIIRLRNPA